MNEEGMTTCEGGFAKFMESGSPGTLAGGYVSEGPWKS
jgi:hypothetical protein